MQKGFYKLFIAAVFLFNIAAAAQILAPTIKSPTCFAIFTDAASFENVQGAILNYRDAVERDGLATWIIHSTWQSPDEVKAEILKLAHNKPALEGVVFVGDIPIAMLRDAQHLSSAFKMDQERFPFIRSSIPSDRFYDDFDLQFEFLEQDTANPLLFYYSLTADSPQKIRRDIYSARMKVPGEGAERYGILRDYLNRIATQKQEARELDDVLTFLGHGYVSEALSAWEGQLLSLREHFPQLYRQNGRLKNLHFTMSDDIKAYLLEELQREELDLAVFHAHGGTDTQYLLGLPDAGGNIDRNISAIKLFLRSKIRQAMRREKTFEEAKAYYQESYTLPDEWFEGIEADSVILADSLLYAKQDIYIDDIKQISPRAEVIIFDQCFTGSFINPEYIAGSYVFGDGSVVAGVANSVNVKQDILPDEFLGLFNDGIRLGNWHKFRNDLENHIIGDPTFHFKNTAKYDLNRMLTTQAGDAKAWQKLLKNEDPTLRALAVRQLSLIEGANFENQLVALYHADPSFNVRLQVIRALAELRTPAFENILFESINDPYELIRRVTVTWMGVVGRADYLPFLAQKNVFDQSDRVSYQAKGAMEKIDPPLAYEKMNLILDALPQSDFRETKKRIAGLSFESSRREYAEELIPQLRSDSLSLKKRLNAVRKFRNYQDQLLLPELIQLIKRDTDDMTLRINALEALGWFAFSHNRSDLITVCDEIMEISQPSEALYREALKTRKRLIAGSNDPLNP